MRKHSEMNNIFRLFTGCCIYKKPKQKFDESSSDTDDECENCSGHVEIKKQKRLQKQQENGSSSECENNQSSSNVTNKNTDPPSVKYKV